MSIVFHQGTEISSERTCQLFERLLWTCQTIPTLLSMSLTMCGSDLNYAGTATQKRVFSIHNVCVRLSFSNFFHKCLRSSTCNIMDCNLVGPWHVSIVPVQTSSLVIFSCALQLNVTILLSVRYTTHTQAKLLTFAIDAHTQTHYILQRRLSSCQIAKAGGCLGWPRNSIGGYAPRLLCPCL